MSLILRGTRAHKEPMSEKQVVLLSRRHLPLLLSAREAALRHRRHLPLLLSAQEVFGAPRCRFLNFLSRLDAVLANFRLF